MGCGGSSEKEEKKDAPKEKEAPKQSPAKKQPEKPREQEDSASPVATAAPVEQEKEDVQEAEPEPESVEEEQSLKYIVVEVPSESLLSKATGKVPTARKQHSVTPFKGSLYFLGGFGSTETVEDPTVIRQSKEQAVVTRHITVFNPADCSWTQPKLTGEAPSARCAHFAVVQKDSLFAFGSHNHKDEKLYELDVGSGCWDVVEDSGKKPGALAGASACAVGDLILVFGGDNGRHVLNELHALDTRNNKWHEIVHTTKETEVQGRRDHSAVAFENKMFIFGGFGKPTDKLEFIVFDAVSKTWTMAPETAGTVPEHRGAHTCSMYQHFMFVFGGVHHETYLNDAHIYDTISGVWTPVVIDVPPRAFSASAIIGNKWYINGGGDGENLFRDFVSVDCTELAKVADKEFEPKEEDKTESAKNWNALVPYVAE